MNKKEFQKKLAEKQQEHQLETLNANKNRAQSLSIGSSASGTTEITMRGETGAFLWNIYQPTQVIEFIHQLAASVGCHIHIQPRNDFSSWRQWKEPSESERLHLKGFPPFALGESNHHKIGLEQKSSELNVAKLEEKENAVATKKAVNKRSVKRTRKSS